MPFKRFHASVSARLLMVYTVIFLLSSLLLLGVVYWGAMYVARQEVNESLLLRTESLESEYDQAGARGVTTLITEILEDGQIRETFYLFADRHYKILAGNASEWPDSIKVGDLQDFKLTVIPDDPPLRVRGNVRKLGRNYLLVADRLTFEKEIQKIIIFAAFVGILAAFLLALVGAGIVIRSMNRRIEVIRRMAERIATGELSARIPVGERRDEFDYLAAILNRMLGRIETLMNEIRHISDNIAHDLRTPLNRLRARLEDGLRSTDDPEQQQSLQRCVDDTAQLIGIFNAILKISDIRSQRARRDFDWVDVDQVLMGVIELYQPLAEERGMRIIGEFAPLEVWGEKGLLGQAVANLIDNAIKFGAEATDIHVTLSDDGILSVADRGPGIPEKEKDKVTERFFRLSKDSTVPGHGLGLSMVRAIAELHEAELFFENNHPGLKVSLSFTNMKKM